MAVPAGRTYGAWAVLERIFLLRHRYGKGAIRTLTAPGSRVVATVLRDGGSSLNVRQPALVASALLHPAIAGCRASGCDEAARVPLGEDSRAGRPARQVSRSTGGPGEMERQWGARTCTSPSRSSDPTPSSDTGRRSR